MLNTRNTPSKAPLAAAIMTAIGLSTAGSAAHGAVNVADGDYVIYVKPTPVVTTAGGYTSYKFGKDGAWNSSFTFGGGAPGASSQGMADESPARRTVTNTDGKSRGTGVPGDGWAGRVGIHVSNNAITFTSFSKDIILNTAGGDFVQLYNDATPAPNAGAAVTGAGGTGTVDANTGAIDMIMMGRLGAIGNPNNLFNERWNFDDFCGTGWNHFTTGSVSTRNTDCSIKTTITGAPLTSLGDLNGDGVTDYGAILVTGGSIGSDWKSFFGAQHFEVWNVNIVSAVIKTATGTATFNTPVNVAIPPVSSTGIAPFTITSATNQNCSNGSVTITSGSVTMDSNGKVTGTTGNAAYTPNSNFAGTDTCTYTITDGNGDAKTGAITITVNAAGAPSAGNDSATTNQNSAVTIDILANDSATGGASLDPSSVAITVPPTNGGTSINTSTGAVTYTPNSGFVGTDTFKYTVNNNVTPTPATSNEATVTVTVVATALTSSGTYGPGTLAVSKGSTDGRITVADVQTDSAVVSQCVGGCFDFKVTGVSTSSVNVALPPLSAAITAQNVTDGLRYRKFMNGAWKTFDTLSGDAVASAPLTAGGGCPTPSDPSWKTWVSATADNTDVGDECIRLSITDNGPNDSDPTTGNIADPSGAGSGTPAAVVIPSNDLGSYSSSTQFGCSISPVPTRLTERGEWWLVTGFLAWLGALVWRRGRGNKQA